MNLSIKEIVYKHYLEAKYLLGSVERRDKVNRILKISLVLLIMFSTLQMMNQSKEVQASSNKASIMLWNDTTKEYLNPPAYTSNQEWQGSKLYWGSDARTPLKWRILGTEDSMFGTTAGVLIEGENFLGSTTFGTNNVYMTSLVADLVDEKYSSSLSPREQSATLISKRDETYYVSGITNAYKDDFSEKEWFAPTMKMLTTTAYGYPDTGIADTTRIFGGVHYLSTAFTRHSSYAGGIYAYGKTFDMLVTNPSQVRAASSLNPNSILLVSNAEDGKISGSGQNALIPVSDTTNGEYKLTLKDPSQSVTNATITSMDASNVATIQYSKKGPGTSLSAMVTDSAGENIISYGRITSVTAGEQTDQIATLALPSDFVTKGYKLKLFTEIYAGDKQTDYASELKVAEVPPLLGTFKFKGADGSDRTELVEFTKGDAFVAPTIPMHLAGYRFLNDWTIEPSDAVVSNKVQKSFTAVAKYIEQFEIKFTNHDGSEIFDTQMIDIGGNAEDPITRTINPLDKGMLDRANYHYLQWENFYDIRENKIIKSMYRPYNYEIKTKDELHTYSSDSAKVLFGSKSEAEIKAELVKVYDAKLYRDDLEQNNYTLEVVIDKLAGLQAGTKGEYEIKFNYTNPLDASFQANKEVKVFVESMLLDEESSPEFPKSEENVNPNDTNVASPVKTGVTDNGVKLVILMLLSLGTILLITRISVVKGRE